MLSVAKEDDVQYLRSWYDPKATSQHLFRVDNLIMQPRNTNCDLEQYCQYVPKQAAINRR